MTYRNSEYICVQLINMLILMMTGVDSSKYSLNICLRAIEKIGQLSPKVSLYFPRLCYKHIKAKTFRPKSVKQCIVLQKFQVISLQKHELNKIHYFSKRFFFKLFFIIFLEIPSIRQIILCVMLCQINCDTYSLSPYFRNPSISRSKYLINTKDQVFFLN